MNTNNGDKRNKSLQIIVVDNGFVFVGFFYKEENLVTIQQCYNIRKYGTTKGLGQLALEGPKNTAELDHCEKCCIDYKRVVFTINCNVVNWRKVFAK